MAGVAAGRLEIELVAEVARLQKDLDKAKRAVNAASKDIARSARHANDNMAGFGRQVSRAGKNTRLANHHMANLSFQLQDIAVGLQAGQRPMTVFMQQGSQIAQIMTQSGVGIMGMIKEIARMAARFVKANPKIAAFAALLGGAALAVNRFKASLNSSGEIDEFVQGLGLTEKELEKLQDQGVTVGDIFKGTWQTLLEVTTLDERIAPFWQWLRDTVAFSASFIVKVMKVQASAIYAAFKGSLEAVRILFTQLPGAIADSVISAANFVIQTLERMANSALGILNHVIGGVNNSFVGQAFGELPKLAAASFGRIENRFAGSAQRMSTDLRSVFSDAFKEGTGAIDSFIERARENILQATKDRLAAQAAEIIKERNGKTGGVAKAKKEIDELRKAIEQALKVSEAFRASLSDEMLKADMSELQLRKLAAAKQILELQGLALVAATDSQKDALLSEASAIGASIAAWEKWYRARADQNLDRDVLQPLRDEIELLGLAGTARERAALWQQKGAILRDFERRGVTDLVGEWQKYVDLHERLWAKQDWLERTALVTRFLNELNKTPAEMAEAFEKVKINGLDALTDGLVDAMVNFESLGDVAQRVIQQILADLLRLQIQQAIIGPLASALGLGSFGGGGSPVNLLAGTPFGGGAASGRENVSPGTAYRIGERGPETFIPRVPGKIVPNSSNDNRTYNISIRPTPTGDARKDRMSAEAHARAIRKELNAR